jgi:hypothetical protein
MAHPSWLEGLSVALHYAIANQQLLTWLVEVVILSLPFFCSFTTPLQPEPISPIEDSAHHHPTQNS